MSKIGKQSSPESGSSVKKRFGQSVRVWRSRLGISQEELAERSGLHRTYISDVERGARNVSLGSMEKLAGGLEISLGMFFSADSFGQFEANAIAAQSDQEEVASKG